MVMNLMNLMAPASAEELTPKYAHCADCRIEWVLVYVPMSAEKASRIMKSRAVCPRCGGKKRVFMGVLIRPTTTGDADGWIANGDTGTSSLTIWSVMTGREVPERHFHPDTPKDPSDFGRCYRLLQVMPAWRPCLPEVSAKYPEWKALVDVWHELTALYQEEFPSGSCPRLYARMQELLGE
jgi:hypothetical protein